LTALVALAACTAVAAGAALVVQACLPDLPGAPAPTTDGGTCGNGYVDLDKHEECDPGPGAVNGAGGCNAGCTMDCPGGYVWPSNHHCYFVSTPSPQLLPTSCAEPSHVVTFASESEVDAVYSFLALFDGGMRKDDPFWVGLSNELAYVSLVDYEPGWDPRCSGCFAHTDDAQAPLPPFDAGPDALAEGCVASPSQPDGGSWVQYPCQRMPRTRTICENEPVGAQWKPCDAGVCIELVITYLKKRYVYQPAPVMADQAVHNCEAIGGRVVVLQSRDEREQLWKQLSQFNVPPTAVWVGLSVSDAGAPDGGTTWVWEDGTILDNSPNAYPPPWGDNEPHPNGSLTRAFMAYVMTSRDNTLAHNITGNFLKNGQLPSTVCELAP
jgi:hypothetical protein